ncbi:Scr1 family TA system antitoxin-like transcriptional regulator [Streptomyces roseolus]|uniref:Scr1 family TA system antitoxin-like transcriptional regulator n=1 Tax=Streptomyces roseolus TaxID=67358 RepID=UPI003660E523
MSGQLAFLPGGQGKKPSKTASHPVARSVGALMRFHRHQRGWNQAEAVRAVPVMGSVPTLSKYETGTTKQDPVKVEAFLHACGAPRWVLEEADRSLRRIDNSPAWAIASDVVDEPLAGLFAMEAISKVIRTYQESGIPGMLQTRAYAKALMIDYTRAQSNPERQRILQSLIDRRLNVRLQRQTLLEEDDAPVFEALIAQHVLTMEVGGRVVLREQLRHLYNLAENRGRIHVRILAGVGGAIHPSIILLKPHEESVGRAVYLEARNRGGELLVEEDDVEMYQAALDDLWERALDKRESMKCLADHIDRLVD